MSDDDNTSFSQKALNVIVQLGEGSFGEGGFDTVKLSNHRMLVNVRKMGSPGFGSASIQIYGMTQSVMNKLSTLGVPLPMNTGRNNIVTIEAGNDNDDCVTVIFRGTTQNVWQDLSGVPDTFLDLEVLAGAFDAMAPAPAISFPGTTDVATIMSGLALRMNRTFENSGVNIKLPNAYYAGTALEQAQACARDAGIEMHDDGVTLAIWPHNGTRGGLIPLVSKDTGMIGFPKYTGQGIYLRTLFNPSITFGGRIEVDSMMKPACGQWYVNELSYSLSSLYIGGPWFCEVGAVRQADTPAR